MWVQTADFRNGKPVARAKDGPTRQVFEQTQDHQVIYGTPGGDKRETMPADEFFATHREATGDEIDEAMTPKAAAKT